MKRIKIASLLLTFVICFTSISALATNDKHGMVTASALNVRSAPNTNSQVLGLLPYGSNLDLIEKINSWYKIAYNNQMAYVCADYIQICEKVTEEQLTSKKAQILETAKKHIGAPYVYGGSSPSGFDCSGFVMYVFSQHGITLPRTSYEQATVGTYVSRENLQPGDIVCFGTSSIGHVGIYVGDGKYIHSPRSGYTVCIDDVDNRTYNKFAYGRRILN